MSTHTQDYFPGAPTPAHTSPQRAQTGTPLGRIVLGVLLGLLAWTAIMAIIGAILLGIIGNQVEDAFTDTSTSVGADLSAPCRAAIDAGADPAETAQCDNDDTAAILAYQATK